MNLHFTMVIEQDDDACVALCPELDIASQGETIAAARDNLREAIELFLEAVPADEIESRLHSEVYITQMEIAVAQA